MRVKKISLVNKTGRFLFFSVKFLLGGWFACVTEESDEVGREVRCGALFCCLRIRQQTLTGFWD